MQHGTNPGWVSMVGKAFIDPGVEKGLGGRLSRAEGVPFQVNGHDICGGEGGFVSAGGCDGTGARTETLGVVAAGGGGPALGVKFSACLGEELGGLMEGRVGK